MRASLTDCISSYRWPACKRHNQWPNFLMTTVAQICSQVDIPYTGLGLMSMSSLGGICPVQRRTYSLTSHMVPTGQAQWLTQHKIIYSLMGISYTGLGFKSVSLFGGVRSVGEEDMCIAMLVSSTITIPTKKLSMKFWPIVASNLALC